MSAGFHHRPLAAALAGRQLLASPIGEVLRREAAAAIAAAGWTVELGSELLFDRDGLALVANALAGYRGTARTLRFALSMDAGTFADYYSLQRDATPERVPLPIIARRDGGDTDGELTVTLPVDLHPMPFPRALAPTGAGALPRGLLLAFQGWFDLLFAEQILLVRDLERRVRASPLAMMRGLLSRRRVPARMRMALAYADIAPSADIHPTALVEGSVIGAGCRVGAHCVVRFSHLGRDVRLHDGAKVELSTVGDGSWLMHDLVLYRSRAEDGCFLIHGPYQFSQFLGGSAAFATIMMDYRPDGRPIRVRGEDGAERRYLGRFLGCTLEPGAKSLGGSLLAPGRIVPADTWLACDPAAVHAADAVGAETNKAIAPAPRSVVAR